MEVIYLLIPLSVVLVLVIVAAFLWAINHAQFDDLERHGRDILLDDDGPAAEITAHRQSAAPRHDKTQ